MCRTLPIRKYAPHNPTDGAVAKLRPWLRAMFECGWCYGWREDEILSLRVRQFDPMARTILLEPGETKNDIRDKRLQWTKLFFN